MFKCKVGDEVGYVRYGGWHRTILIHGFSRVVKINHHGHIHLENGRQFDRHGDERKQTYWGLRLIDAAALRERLAEHAVQRARNTAAHELKALIDVQRNGHGDICKVNDETRARMIALVNQL